ncbi:HAMP domain-containing histidine kinase, partial [bacterium]|nr:HAMP domain-containing histidine kinase [bacterium]
DGHSYVGVLSADGREIWLETAGGSFTSTQVKVADMNRDDVDEVVSLTTPESGAETISSLLVVRDARSGATLAQQSIPERVESFHIIPETKDAPPRVVAANSAGEITVWRLAGGELTAVARRATIASTRIDGTATVGGMTCVLSSRDDGVIAAYSPELRKLAEFHPHGPVVARPPEFISTYTEAPGVTRLLAVSDKVYLFDLVRSPLGVLRTGGVALLLALTVLLSAVGASRSLRRQLASTVLGRLATHLPWAGFAREQAQVELLSSLEMGQHDKAIVTRPLRSLQRALGMATEGADAAARVAPLIEKGVRNYRELTKGAVRQIIERSAAWGGAPGLTRELRTRLRLIDSNVAPLAGWPTNEAIPERHARSFGRDVDGLDEALSGLRELVAEGFITDVSSELDRAGEICVQDLADSGLALELDLRESRTPRVLLAPRDFQFLVVNMITNAIRATASTDRKQLLVIARTEGNELHLRFADTGHGVPDEDHERIFEYGRTTKTTGGRGLYFSRAALERHGGTIVVERSRSGEGTTFLVKLLAAPSLKLEDGGE